MKPDKEQIKGLLAQLLPQPISSGKQMIAGDPPEVVAQVSDEGLLIAPYRAQWQGPHKLKVVVSDTDIVGWGDLAGTTEQLQTYLSQKVEAAQKARKTTFKVCSLCDKSTPPEWMHDENACQSCASNIYGTVY